MSMSIRNQLPGTVTDIATGEVMTTVKVRLDGGQQITAAITLDALEDLGLGQGSPARALIKATEVSLATGMVGGLSIRNQLPGSISGVATGGAMARVKVAVAGGELTAVITKDAVDDLGLAAGSPVVALIKSTEVALATG